VLRSNITWRHHAAFWDQGFPAVMMPMRLILEIDTWNLNFMSQVLNGTVAVAAGSAGGEEHGA
jgi:hypothetical protein